MHSKIYWLFAFVGLYWAYCIFWGIKGARASKTSEDYFVAGRSIGTWVFVLAATATSFSGWTFVGHPGKILTDGLPYAFASFYALTIPFTGVLFLRRQWVLGRSFNYITPGEMYSDYYGGNIIRGLTVLVAFLFSVPYLGIQLRASGALFNILTDGMISTNLGMILLGYSLITSLPFVFDAILEILSSYIVFGKSCKSSIVTFIKFASIRSPILSSDISKVIYKTLLF